DGVIRRRGQGPGWKFLGQPVCFEGFCHLTGVSRRQCSKFLKAIREGALEPPADGRSLRVSRDEPKRDHARSFFQYLYDHLAEPLAEGLDPELDESTEWIDPNPRAAPAESNQNPVGAAAVRPVLTAGRWLHHMKFVEIYEMYTSMYGPLTNPQDVCGRSVLRDVYLQEWRFSLRIRKTSQHTQCKDCVRFSRQRRAHDLTESQKQEITQAANLRKHGVFQDRGVGRKLMFLSESATTQGTHVAPELGTLYICLDGMDQDFVQCIKETLKPARGRELFAEKLEGLWDWQKFMEPMERVMSGVAILKSQPDVNYAFRIVTRKDMKLYSGYEKWVDMADEEHEALDQCPEGPADGDVFLLCKQFMHSTSLSQKPVLLTPERPAREPVVLRKPASAQPAKKKVCVLGTVMHRALLQANKCDGVLLPCALESPADATPAAQVGPLQSIALSPAVFPCGWNALNQRQADLAKKLQGHIRPRFMMASPPCTMYSPLMRLWNFRKMQPAVRKRRQGEAHSMVDTAVDRCLEQRDRGDLFAFEHPANASSWRQHRKLAKARKTKNTYEVLFDQCAVGLRSPSGKPMKKRTRLWTNSLAMVRRFKVMQCKCQQPHKRICGSEMGYKLSKWAQCYPKKMVNTLLLGAKDDMSK
ncbi:unnamed protein product, partial [Durusdinium trenchii]